METQPLVEIKQSKPISVQHALNGIEKFIKAHSLESVSLSATNRERQATLPEDVIAKLTTITAAMATEHAKTVGIKVSSKRRASVGDEVEVEEESSPVKPKKEKRVKV